MPGWTGSRSSRQHTHRPASGRCSPRAGQAEEGSWCPEKVHLFPVSCTATPDVIHEMCTEMDAQLGHEV